MYTGPSRAEISHYIFIVSQVLTLLAWAAQHARIPRSRRTSLEGSQASFRALSPEPCCAQLLETIRQPVFIARTSVFFFTETRPDLFLHRHFRGLSGAVGRGIPDISAQAVNYYILVKGKGFRVSGTSAPVPVRFLSLDSTCSSQLITERIAPGGQFRE